MMGSRWQHLMEMRCTPDHSTTSSLAYWTYARRDTQHRIDILRWKDPHILQPSYTHLINRRVTFEDTHFTVRGRTIRAYRDPNFETSDTTSLCPSTCLPLKLQLLWSFNRQYRLYAPPVYLTVTFISISGHLWHPTSGQGWLLVRKPYRRKKNVHHNH